MPGITEDDREESSSSDSSESKNDQGADEITEIAREATRIT